MPPSPDWSSPLSEPSVLSVLSVVSVLSEPPAVDGLPHEDCAASLTALPCAFGAGEPDGVGVACAIDET